MKKTLKKRILNSSILLSSVLSMATISVPQSVYAKTIEPTLEYSSHIENIGWMNPVTSGISGTTGEAKRMEALKLSIKNVENVSLNFDVHLQNYGWKYGLTEKDVIGTTGEAIRMEALVIRTNGLLEKGYKLQYRVHVENIGWMAWTDEGTMAGTTGESKRIEAIEIRLVKVTTPLEVIIEGYKNQVEAYTLALVDTLSEEELIKVSEEIDKSIEELEKAQNEETAEEIYNEIIGKIINSAKLNTPGELDKKLQEIMEAAEEAKTNVANLISIYKKVLTDSDLSASSKANIEKTIAKAENSIEAAKTATQVNAAYNKMEAVLDNYKSYYLDSHKQIAIAELNEIAKNVEVGLQNEINKVIEQIESKDTKTISAVDTLVNGIKSKQSAIANAQKENLEKIAKYVELMDYVELSSAEKAILNVALDNAREEVKNATIPQDITNAMNSLDSVMKSASYNEYKEIIALQDTISAAIKTNLSDYFESDYDSVKALANLYETYYEDCLTLENATETINAITAALKATTAENIGTEVTVGKNKYMIKNLADLTQTLDQEAEEKEAEAIAYKETYDKAIETIKNYEENINIVDISEEDKKELSDLVANTKTTVKNSTTTSEITEAMSLLTEYVATYYPELEEEASIYKFTSTQEKAIEKLTAYKNSEIVVDSYKVSQVANEAIKEIEAVKVDDQNALTTITTKTEQALTTIERLEAQSNALKTLDTYKDSDVSITYKEQTLDYDGIVSKIKSSSLTKKEVNTMLEEVTDLLDQAVEAKEQANAVANAKKTATSYMAKYFTDSTEITIDGEQKTVGEVAIEAHKVLEGLSTVDEVNDALENFKTTIKDAVAEKEAQEAEEAQKALDSAKKNVHENIDEYISMANDLENTQLVTMLNSYKSRVEEATTPKDANIVLNDVNTYITDAYPMLAAKSTKINTIKTGVAVAKTNDTLHDLIEYASYAKIVNKAIEDIKAYEGSEIAELDTIVSNAEAACTEEKTKIEAYLTLIKTTKAKIAENSTGAEALVEYYNSLVDAVSYEKYLNYKNDLENKYEDIGDIQEATYEVFTQITANAVAAIAKYLA